MDEDLFEGSDVFVLQLGFEYISLELSQLIVIEVAVLVLVTYPEYSLEGSLILWFELLVDRVEERRDGVEHCPLRTVHHVDEVHVAFGRALDAHLYLLVLQEVGVQLRFQVARVVLR